MKGVSMKNESYKSHNKSTIFWALIIITIGVILLFNNLDIIDIKDLLRDYWPVLLIFFGLYLIMKRDRFHFDGGIAGDKDFICNTDKAIYSNVFGDLDVQINSPNFEEGKKILNDSKIKILSATGLDDAAKKIVEVVK